MDIFTGHDLNNDGENDVYVRHSLNGQASMNAVALIWLAMAGALAIGGLWSLMFLPSILFAPSDEELAERQREAERKLHGDRRELQKELEDRLPEAIEAASREGWRIQKAYSSHATADGSSIIGIHARHPVFHDAELEIYPRWKFLHTGSAEDVDVYCYIYYGSRNGEDAAWARFNSLYRQGEGPARWLAVDRSSGSVSSNKTGLDELGSRQQAAVLQLMKHCGLQ